MRYTLVCGLLVVGIAPLLADEAADPRSSTNSRAKTFIDNTRGKPPRENLVQALRMFDEHFRSISKRRRLAAADLGAGAGNETIHLLTGGWDVTSIDIEPYAIQVIKERNEALRDTPGSTSHGTLDPRLSSMQDMSLGNDAFDLVNASLSLPFVSQDQIKDVWKEIVQALKPGGIFTGHFFGPEHQWRNRRNMSFFSVSELFEQLFQSSGLEIRYLTNEKEQVGLGSGGTAFFHTITVIARKVPTD